MTRPFHVAKGSRMSSGEQQLQADFARVKKLLNDYPSIKLVATEGDPPEQYDIEYRIKGYKANPDGTILPANRHLVRITLPFGYPHFPPTAKPLSSIFHPDIDPDAIRIADFWNKSTSLPQLIIHIGEMICGTFYSSDPFNQRAFDWYEERKSWMPFDILEPHEGDDDEPSFTGVGQTAGSAGTASAPIGDGASALEPMAEATSQNFAAEEKADQETATEFPELDDLLDGEFSHAFDLGEGDDLPSAPDGTVEDLTAMPETDALPEIEFELAAQDEPIEDLTEDLPFSPPHDLGLELETETAFEDLQAEDFAPAEGVDFNVESDQAAEPPFPQEESIELGDLADLGEALALASEGTESDATVELEQPLSEDLTIDFGIPASAQIAGKTEPAPTTPPDEGILGGISLQLDEDQGKKFDGQIRSIQTLIEQKEIFTAKRVLADIPDPASLPELEDLEQTIAAAIGEAEELYKKADRLEQKGQLEKAGLLLDLVANIATDYPGLDFARNRVRESLMGSGPKQNGSGADKGKEGAEPGANGAGASPPDQKNSSKLQARIPYRLISGILALVVIVGGGTALYLKDNAGLVKARTEYATGEQLVDKREFKEAQKAFQTARSELGKVLVFGRGEKERLSRDIDTVVQAQTFKEGLQGRVLHNGRYVSIEAARAIDSFARHTASAEKARQTGKADQAIAAYEKSLEFAEAAGEQDKTAEIQQSIDALRLEEKLSLARQAEERKEWRQAADQYQAAVQLSSGSANPEEQDSIRKRLALATLNAALAEGQQAFTASEWSKAVEKLQAVRKIIAVDPTMVDANEQEEINRLDVNARVFQILAEAKDAFTRKMWEEAITIYARAVQLLRDNEALLGVDEVADSVSKIEKTVLLTRITREQSGIERTATESGKLSANLEHYQTIVALIDKSPLKEDQVIKEIYQDSLTQIKNLKEEILVSGKLEYLKENYQDIFRQNYPSASSSELSAPQVNFARREGNILIFSMSCAERNQGRTFRLELNYQYDLDKGTWGLYSGKL